MNKYSKTKLIKRCSNILVSFLITIIIIFSMIVFLFSIKFIGVNNSNDTNPMFTEGNLELFMLDVGQGKAFLLLQNDEAMLVDAGTMYNPNLVRNYLEKIGVKELNYLVITHPHQDHAGGLMSVLANVKVHKVITTKIPSFSWSIPEEAFITFHKLFLKYVNIMSMKNMVTTYQEYEGDIKFADSKFYFMPMQKEKYSNVNDYSLVMKVTFNDVKILLTGDIEKTRERELLNSEQDISATIYDAAHHGSRTSNQPEFLDKVNPQYVLISSNNRGDNLFGHPVKSFMDYLKEKQIPVYRTDESGTIIAEIDGKKVVFDTDQDDYRSGKELQDNSN